MTMKSLVAPFKFSAFGFCFLIGNIPMSLFAQGLSPELREGVQTFMNGESPDKLLRSLTKTPPSKDPKSAVLVRLKVLSEVMKAYDPTYDTNPPPFPQSHASPPVGYDSGISPESITDPRQRAEYEKRIAANAQLARVHNAQRALRTLLQSVGSSLSAMKDSASENDKQEIVAQIQALPVTEPVKQSLRRNLE